MIEPLPELKSQEAKAPALAISEESLTFTAPDGTARIITVSDLVENGDPSQLLAWATFLVQKDMLERMGMMAHAISELAQVLNNLVQRAQAQPQLSHEDMIKKTLEQARDMVAGLMPKK